MAIVKMMQFHLTLFSKQREQVFEELQRFGRIHLKKDGADEDSPLEALNSQKDQTTLLERMHRFDQALAILDAYQEEDKSFQGRYGNRLKELQLPDQGKEALVEKMDGIAAQLFAEKQKLDRAKAQIQSIKEEKLDLSKWKALDAPLEKLQAPRSVRVRLGSLASRWLEDLRKFAAQDPGLYVEFISGDEKEANVLLMEGKGDLASREDFLREIQFQEKMLPGKGTVKDQLAQLDQDRMLEEKKVADQKLVLKDLARQWREDFQLAYELDSFHLKRLQKEELALESRYLTYLDGYIAQEDQEKFQAFLASFLDADRYMLRLEEVDPEDPEIPVLLKNAAWVQPFESIVETYSLPLYKEMDPTPLLAPWYIAFFSIMLGDLGYGAVMVLATTLILKWIPLQEKTQSSMRFFRILGLATMLVGACFGSIFGGLIPMKPLILDPTQDYMTMIIFSVALGFVHILVGLLLQGIQLAREKDYPAILYDAISWILILVGLAMAGLQSVLHYPAFLQTVGFILAIVGAFLVLLFSARDEKGWGARIAWGTYNLYGSTSYVGDIVSYTRLTALMLSGAYIGYSFNMIGGMLTGMGVPGYVLAALVLVVAHLFNLFLSALSAYVHSMRLIYVEFFGKFYQGGGKAFEGLRPQAKYVQLVEKENN